MGWLDCNPDEIYLRTTFRLADLPEHSPGARRGLPHRARAPHAGRAHARVRAAAGLQLCRAAHAGWPPLAS